VSSSSGRTPVTPARGRQIFGFLGTSGAGKTTTIEILEGDRACSSGEVLVLGVDP
jgi:ABC-2 type transport system ATP-binding protein